MLHPRPAHRASYPLLCAIGPRFRFRPSLRSPRGDTVAFNYPSALPAWGRTCSLYTYRIFVTLDAVLKSGTLAERPDKRPGIPGTQQGGGEERRYAPSLTTDVGSNEMNLPLAIIIDMTKPSVAIPIYVAISLVIVLFLWFLISQRVPFIDKCIVLSLITGLWLYSDATARNWQKVTLPNGRTTIMDFYVHGHTYIVATSILGIFLILVSVALAVFDWRRKRTKIQPSSPGTGGLAGLSAGRPFLPSIRKQTVPPNPHSPSAQGAGGR